MPHTIDHLTTKDLAYLKDELSWTLVAAKKCFKYARETQDSGLQDLFHWAGQKHQSQYERLLHGLNSASQRLLHGLNSASQSQPQPGMPAGNPQPAYRQYHN